MKNLVKGAVLAVGLLVASNAANAQQKIGHINSEEVFQSTPEFKTASEQLKVLGESKQKEIEAMFAELQKKETEASQLEQNRSAANKAETDTKLQALGQEYQAIQKRVQDQRKLAEEDFGKKQQELFTPIQTKVMNAINAVAKEKGYAYVLDLSTGGVIYFQGGEDVSPLVKAKLGIK